MKSGFSVKMGKASEERLRGIDGPVMVYSLTRDKLSDVKPAQFELALLASSEALGQGTTLNVQQEVLVEICNQLAPFAACFFKVSFTSLGVRLVWGEGLSPEKWDELGACLKVCWQRCAESAK